MSCIHSSVSLDYSFPSARHFDVNRNRRLLPREALINQNLTLERMPAPKEPQCVSEPIKQWFNSPLNDDPLEALYSKLRPIIDAYMHRIALGQSATLLSRPENRHTFASKVEAAAVDKTLGYQCSPSTGKTLHFSPKVAGKAAMPRATPETKDSARRKLDFDTPGLSKVRKIDLLQISTKKPADPVQIYEDSHPEIEEDNLACHAGHILRMAMDTTILGSSYNSTINLSFGMNDSILGSKRPLGNVLDNLDDSMLGKRGQSLNTTKAMKIEISAEDLNNAIYAD